MSRGGPRRGRRRIAGPRRVLLAGAAAFLAAAGGFAAQWVVDDDGPADFRTPQAAHDAAYVVSGDLLLVRPGVYYGNLYLHAKDLDVRSETGPLTTVLDAQGAGSVVLLEGRTAATRIEGFTIRGGRDQTGGGVWIYGGAPVVTRNIIEGNNAAGGFLGYGYGGGIEIFGAAPVITDNVIRGNTALDGGGGIDVYYSGPGTPGTCCPLIARNTLVENRVTAATGVGGGILSFASQPRITSSILAGNSAAAGGGFYAYRPQGNGDEPEATANIVHGNLPDDAASNGGWRLSAANPRVDPRLGPGPGIGLHPRSDSPALEAAEPSLPAGADLLGVAPADGDLDGLPLVDIGALENRSEITELRATHDPLVPAAAVLSWDGSIDPTVLFNLYADDDGPFRDDGGLCLAPALDALEFRDLFVPSPGRARFYVVTGRGAVEGSRGFRSDGSARPSAPACPGG